MTVTEESISKNMIRHLLGQDASNLQKSHEYESTLGFLSRPNHTLPSYRIVIDACVMRNEIRRYISLEGRPTFIQEVNRSSVGQVHAPGWIETELEASTLPSLYKSERISPRILSRIAETLLEEITIPTGYEAPVDTNLPENVDLKEEPYVRLAKDINALGILSWDKGFDKYFVQTFREDVIRQMQHLARLLNAAVQVRTAGKITTIVSANAVDEIYQASMKALKKLPKEAVVIGGIAGGAAALYYFTQTEHGRRNRHRYLELAKLGVGKAFAALINVQNELQLIEKEKAALVQCIEESL